MVLSGWLEIDYEDWAEIFFSVQKLCEGEKDKLEILNKIKKIYKGDELLYRVYCLGVIVGVSKDCGGESKPAKK